jgi:hypothetical protein
VRGFAFVNYFQGDPAGVDEKLAGVFEIHRHSLADHRLHLADAPIRPVGVADALAGFQEDMHGGFTFRWQLCRNT